MTAGTSALLLSVGAGVVGVTVWIKDGPTVVTAGPDQLTVPGGIGDGIAVPKVPPLLPDPDRAPGIVGGIDPATTEDRFGSGGLAKGLDPAPAAVFPPKATTAPGRTEAPATSAPTTRLSRTENPGTKDTATKLADSTRDRTRTTVPAPHRTTEPGPVITTRTEVETRSIPFRTRLVRDPELPRGTKNVRAEGQAGVRSLRYLVTLTDGKRTGRRLLDTKVTKRPAHRLVAIGVGRDRDRDTDQDTGDDTGGGTGGDPWDCGAGELDDVCLPFGRSTGLCADSDEPDGYGGGDSSGSGAGMIVLGDPLTDDGDLELPDGYGWAC